MYVNKNATLADAVACRKLSLNWGREKLSNTESIIIESPRPKDPHIMGLLRPNRSRKMVGKMEPTMNMHWTAPPISKLRFCVSPTFWCNRDGTK
jgi:hypothetical protein